MRKPAFGLALLLALALAQSAGEILDRVARNLQDPWQATLQGTFQGPMGREELRVRVLAIPRENLFRLEFQRPGSLEGNFTVITEREVWNYLYLTNQLIVTPKERAQVQGLGLSPQALVDPGALLERVGFRLLGEERLPEGVAWRLLGQAKEGQGFATLELYVLKADPRPLRLVFRDEAGVVLADLGVAEFRRASLRPQDLRRYPRDAQVIRR
ncbi:outer membrane lipoprotein carrier protein LolA [Thermus thermamylovorans]|uniref:Outer membrane lipoprotein carrier protein LolA n=1 Tax=Thermus thermamylovorans TaxID=2509362 RepID=A0A4Q9B705_9DEIN|nr:outer membrane lipoprotein carrier protein LolA [Thermus thermamylovorans]TBH21261.1 outer membrane lipoprotein carrier protein LolA [Thermus thermamylovorans]